MNWSNLLRYRKQVEDLAREELVLTQWEKSREQAKREGWQRDMQTVALDLERNLRSGIDTSFAEQRFRWLEEVGHRLEEQTSRLHVLDHRIEMMREKVRKTHHARRVVEMVIAKKEEELLHEMAKREQREMEESIAHRYAMKSEKEAV